ncbi:alpha-protein kinase 3 isoform X4 [Esox lucius]|uniref:alpha-protein kinase 3 isoform X4 n=1 Tax=Esox lucius TaxID=8010 RepID=UPI0014769779|nr:alpha-protein kinase 3 isoform X4 [Esox lucius]
MSSRRLTTRSYSAGDGRSGYHNVDDVTGSSRANSRANSHSYLSSVRPEHSYSSHSYSQYRPSRSTLHCVMQQLTEETQPYFESTLKSKAVSETCNTMFTCDVSGHPTPEVTWYKDDVQLDRYCGLPKYNISRNGQNHSLHIYNCSEEDAAIYQASARNSKGIVSCSGVLEVGTMTEYKIHQQYFAKMKLNAEKNSRELEKPKVWDKENHISLDGQQETQRTISPDRSQRKRHSPMDHSFIAPSSMENEVVEKNTLAQAAEVESRIQDRVAGEEEMETTVIGTGASYIKRQTAITENGSSKGLTYDHDSLQKYFAPHTPKVSLSKKKVKIFKGEESSVTADSQAGKGPERDSGMSEEGKVSVTFCLADSATLPIEAMEVESAVDPSASKMNGVNYMKQTKKDPQNNTVSIMEDVKVQLDEKTLVKTLPHKDESTSPGFSSKGQTTSGTKNQTCSVAQVTRKVGNNNIKGSHSTVPPVTSIQPQAHTSDKLQPKPIIPVELQPQPSLAVELQPQPSTSVTLQPQPSASLKLQPQPRPPSVTSQPQQSEIVKPPVQTSLSVKPPEQTSLSVKPPTQPSLSVKPQAQPSLSVKPQAQPSLLVKPRAQPSLSVKPSAHPSLLVKPQAQPSLIVKPQAQPSHPVKLQAQPILSTKPEAQPSLSLNPETQPSHHSAKLQPQPNKRSPLSGELVPQLCQSSGPSAKRNPSPSANLHSQSSPSQTQQPQTSPSVTLQPQPSSCPHMSNSSSKGIGTNQNIIMDNKPSAPGNLNSFTAKAKTECSSKDSATVLGILQSDTSSIHQTGRAGHVAGGTVPSVLMIPRESSKSVSALPQRLCEQAGDQMSEEETSTSLKNVSVSQLPVLLGEEVTQKHRQKIERNGTPVCPESVTPTTRSKLNMPRKHSPSASDEELVTDANKRTPAVHNTPGQSASDKLTQGTQEYSRGSNESNTVPFTEPLMSPLESHGAATPQELASGARRKIIIPKVQGEDPKAAASPTDVQSPHREEVSRITFGLSPESPSPKSPCQSLRFPLRQNQSGQHTPPAERQSPLLVRRKVTQNPETTDTAKTEEKPSEQDKHKHNPFKAPQVIRKIRGEPFSDAAGHLKLWCQFFNVLSDSTIRWFRDEVEIATDKRSSGDETQVALAIVHTSSIDCGVYGCTITNEYGTDTTDFLLSVDILSGMFLRDDQEVGEEIEMTPLLFTKGLADSGTWGRKFFGRIMTEEAHIGKGCSHKACKVKVIYGLDPVFESGSTCYIKVKSPIAYYGAKGESNLVERNHAMTQQECRIQNMAREYSKIFAAECRVIETFGAVLEVIPVYLIYRPANTIPHATVETDLNGDFVRYSQVDASGRLVMGTGSEAALKCSALQHWIHQWTNGNLLLTRMEGVDLKITNVSVSIKSKGYQSLTITENPSVFEQFVSQHHCNYYCGLLSLKLLKSQDSLQTPAKPKGSRSPLLHRKVSGSSSPQPSRKATGSPRLARKEVEPEDSKSTTNLKNVDFLKVVQS